MTAETNTDEFLDTAPPWADESTDTDETAYRQSLDSSGIMSGAFGLTRSQIEAYRRFTEAQSKLSQPVSCQQSPDLWFDTKNSASRQYAIGHCLACPLVDHCRRYADSLSVGHGIWAGENRSSKTPHPTKGQS